MLGGLREVRLAPVKAAPPRPLAVLPNIADRAGVIFGFVGERRELIDGQLELAGRERPDRHPMLRAFIVDAVLLGFPANPSGTCRPGSSPSRGTGRIPGTRRRLQCLLLRGGQRRLRQRRRAQSDGKQKPEPGCRMHDSALPA
jgi:hypothetical protein